MVNDLTWLRDSIVILAVTVFLAAAVTIAIDDFQGSTGTTNSVNEENVTVSGTRFSPALSSFPYELVSVTGFENDSLIGVFGTTVNCTYGDGGYCDVNSTFTGGTFNVTYSYLAADKAYNSTYYGLQAEQNASSYFSTIGTIMGVAVLIMIVIGSFYFARS